MIVDKISQYNKNHQWGMENERLPEADVDKIIEEVEIELKQTIHKKLTNQIRATYKASKRNTINSSINIEYDDNDDSKTAKFLPSVEVIDTDEAEEEFSKNLSGVLSGSIKREAFKTRYQKVKD